MTAIMRSWREVYCGGSDKMEKSVCQILFNRAGDAVATVCSKDVSEKQRRKLVKRAWKKHARKQR